MPTYKLSYFPARGRAELTRLVFAAAGEKYEDSRLNGEQWQAYKPSTPFGQMPVLEADGVKICQSNTIARFVAKRFGLAGKNDVDEARANMVVDCIEDISKLVVAVNFESDETKKAELKKKWAEQQEPQLIGNLEKLLVSNNGGDGYFVGDALTWADLAVFVVLGNIQELNYDSYPKLKNLNAKVASHAGIKEWLKNRPETKF